MAAYSLMIIVVVAIMIALAFFARRSAALERRVRDVPAKPGATSVLSITAFVAAVILPPLGIILGHLALFRVGLGEARGRAWATRALWVGYLLLAVELVVLVVLYPGLRWFG